MFVHVPPGGPPPGQLVTSLERQLTKSGPEPLVSSPATPDSYVHLRYARPTSHEPGPASFRLSGQWHSPPACVSGDAPPLPADEQASVVTARAAPPNKPRRQAT